MNNSIISSKYFYLIMVKLSLMSLAFSQNEAGSIFLLISPDAKASSMGEAQVAISNNSYSSYWNPAGLAFTQGSGIAASYSSWLPNIVDDIAYNFIGYRNRIEGLGVIGAHIIFMDLGTQKRMDEQKSELGSFSSYSFAAAISYGNNYGKNSSLGLTAKYSSQVLMDATSELGGSNGSASVFGFDIGYMKKAFLLQKLNFGMTLTNMGGEITFLDDNRSDPQPTNLTLGLHLEAMDNSLGRLNLIYDVKKLMVASYAATDINSDGLIDGKNEMPHTDPFFKALFTSWTDDWKYKGDLDKSIGYYNRDGIIGGYRWVESLDNGDGIPDPNEMERTSEAVFGDENWGIYNQWGQKEVGSKGEGSFSKELKELIHNFGIEYMPNSNLAFRSGYIYDKIGDINNLTYGFGLRFAGYDFDFSYIDGDVGHPLANTYRFSLGKRLK